MDLTEKARRHLGIRAAEHVDVHGVPSLGRTALLVPDTEDTPESIARTLTRVYGRPYTRDRGEVAYWEIGSGDLLADA